MAIPFKTLVKTYGNTGEIWVVEKDPNMINTLKNSKAAATWGCGVIEDTGWVKLAQYSPSHLSPTPLVLVCKQEQY